MIRHRPTRRLMLAFLPALLTMTGLVAASPASAASGCESQMASELNAQVNAERAARGLPSAQAFDATVAQSWAETLRSNGSMGHSPANWAPQYGFASGDENVVAVGVASSSGAAMTSFMASTAHRAAILSPRTDRVGTGVAYDPAHNRVIVVMHLASSTMPVALRPQDANPPASPVVTAAGQGSVCSQPAPPTTPAPPTPPPSTPPSPAVSPAPISTAPAPAPSSPAPSPTTSNNGSRATPGATSSTSTAAPGANGDPAPSTVPVTDPAGDTTTTATVQADRPGSSAAAHAIAETGPPSGDDVQIAVVSSTPREPSNALWAVPLVLVAAIVAVAGLLGWQLSRRRTVRPV